MKVKGVTGFIQTSLGPLYIIGRDCDHGIVESKNTSQGHPHGNHLCVGLGSQVYHKVNIDFIEV
jgi:hypothetical protein